MKVKNNLLTPWQLPSEKKNSMATNSEIFIGTDEICLTFHDPTDGISHGFSFLKMYFFILFLVFRIKTTGTKTFSLFFFVFRIKTIGTKTFSLFFLFLIIENNIKNMNQTFIASSI